jgi:hypothetical protein
MVFFQYFKIRRHTKKIFIATLVRRDTPIEKHWYREKKDFEQREEKILFRWI